MGIMIIKLKIVEILNCQYWGIVIKSYKQIKIRCGDNMSKRIKEDDIEDIIKSFNNKKYEKIKMQFLGFIKQETTLTNPHVLFDNRRREIIIKNSENTIKINLGYVEEIYFEQKNKLKFLTDKELEILIIFL